MMNARLMEIIGTTHQVYRSLQHRHQALCLRPRHQMAVVNVRLTEIIGTVHLVCPSRQHRQALSQQDPYQVASVKPMEITGTARQVFPSPLLR
jgi:hypothetical protein